MQTPLNPSSYRLRWVAGSAIILFGAVSIVVVLARSTIPSGGNSGALTPAAAPSPIVDAKAYTMTLAPPISNPLQENMKMIAFLDLHRHARNGILTQGYKTTARFEDGSSRVNQKEERNLSD